MERLLGEMSIRGREWMWEVLSDLCEHQNNPDAVEDIKLEQFYALGVGPLRTSTHGTIDANDKDNVLDLIWTQLRKQGETLENTPCSLRSFQELTPETLQQYQQQFNLVDLDRKLVKSVARSAGALAIFSLIS
jgi:hypothetical protein